MTQPAMQKDIDRKRSTIVQDGSRYMIYGDVGLVDLLPSKVFDIKIGAFGAVYMEEAASIVLPEKIYSNDTHFIEHVLRSYESANGSLGILLSGKKGLGKSFTANVICQKLGLPVIRVTSKIDNKIDLFGFLNKIEQEHIIFIDEFEKIFSSSNDYAKNAEESSKMSQNDFLSFLDSGTIGTKRLFIITSNDRVSDYLMNRPSRIRYHRQYDKMEVEVITEIVEDLMVNESYKQDLIENVSHKHVNIDVLIKIIEEVNLHNKPYTQFKDFFNFSSGLKETFSVTDDNGRTIQSEVEIIIPLQKGQALFYDIKQKDNVHLDDILSETQSEIVIRGTVENIKYNGRDEEEPFEITSTYTLRKKYSHLF